MNKQLIMKSLPLVASVLGRKYGVNVLIGGDSAYTDGRNIHLPSLPLDSDETLIGLARGYLDHESAHIRETDFRLLKKSRLTALEHQVWNTLEDWRVEHRLADVFPGCRQNFNWLVQHLFGSDDAQETDPAMAILNWLLLCVRAWDVPALEKQRDGAKAFVNYHYPGLTERLDSVLQKVRADCNSTLDCIKYAREIVKILRDTLKDGVPDPPDKDSSTGTEGSQSKPGISDTQKRLKRLFAAAANELPSTMGQALAESLCKGIPQNADRALSVAQSGNKKTAPLTPDEIATAKKATAALQIRIQALLQASVLTRSQTGHSGRPDLRQLHRLAIADPRVFRRKSQKTGLNTAVHILVDSSGSMHHRIKLTSQACYAVATALEPIKGISTGVSTFPGGAPSERTQNRHNIPTIRQILRHGEPMHSNFNVAAAGRTQLGESLWWVLQQMQHLPESRKLILILTDGEPDSHPIAHEAIKQAKSFGVELYGLGIMSNAVEALLPGNSRTINNLDELPSAMFEMLQKAIVKTR